MTMQTTSPSEILHEVGRLPRDTTDPIERAALLAYDRGCREGHGPYKSVAWDLAVQIYMLKFADGVSEGK